MVPFSNEFKMTLTIVMALDYAGCWVVENVLKRLFSDFRPKDIAVRRPDQLAIEDARKRKEQEEKDRAKESARGV